MSSEQTCLRCNQGWVVRRMLSVGGKPFWVCDECDGIWFGESPGSVPDDSLRNYFDSIVLYHSRDFLIEVPIPDPGSK
jgi:hypothetical protein